MSILPKKLRILVISIQSHGHLNMCIGICQQILKRGHTVCFAVTPTWKGKLAAYGFDELLYEPEGENGNQEGKLEEFACSMTEQQKGGDEFRIQHFANYLCTFVDIAARMDKVYEKMVEDYKPDIILSEDAAPYPYLQKAADKGIPWVRLNSCAPLCMEIDDLPPCWWGLSTKNPDYELWNQKRAIRDRIYIPVHQRLNEWLVREGFPPHKQFIMTYWSPFLNIYNYPKECDYFVGKQLPGPTVQVDSCVRQLPDRFEFPAEFLAIPGKHTVYVSMGTLASINSNLMQRIVDALRDTPNRYFVSKGANGDKLVLPPNCYGVNFVPQTEILPLVDAIITHGGNNTFTECFTFGVPMIVMPFFSDQPDNAQRLEDLGLGRKLDPFNLDESELRIAVETVLNDCNIRVRMKQAAKRIRNDQSVEKAIDRIEALCQSKIVKNGHN